MAKTELDLKDVISKQDLTKYVGKVARNMLSVKYQGYYGSNVSTSTMGYTKIRAALNKALTEKLKTIKVDKDVAAYVNKVIRNMCLRWRPDKEAQKEIDKILNKHLEDYIANMTQRQKDALIVKHLTIKS